MPISTGTSGSSSATTWAGASIDTYDVRGLGLPNEGKNKVRLDTMTGEQLFQRLSYLAQTGDPIWGNIRNVLTKTGAYGQSIPNFNYNWTNDDIAAVKSFITGLHNFNSVAPKPVSLTTYMNDSVKRVSKNGIATGTKAPVSVPATADLTNAAEKAFQTTLGRNPTADESAKFAKQFQDMVLAYGSGKQTAKTAASFAAPKQPIAFQEPNMATPKPADISTTKTSAIQEPVSAGVAAQNFAARTSPTEASAAAAAGSLDQFLTMLKG